MSDQQVKKNRATYQITINTTNYISGTNRYRLNFPSPIDFTSNNAKLGVYQYSVYNSTYNISSKYNNNTYSIKWIDGTVYSYTIPDGYYDFTALNQTLQYDMAKDKLYLQNTTTSNQVLYFISCYSNSVQYASQIDILYVPSTGITGYTIPSGATWTYPAQATYPQLILSDGLRKLFGFETQTQFPTSQTVPTPNQNVSFVSDTYPVLSPIFCYMLGCNFIQSPINTVPNVFYQIPLSNSFGGLVKESTAGSAMLTVHPSKYQYIEITTYDQFLNPLVLLDPEITITLILEFDI